MSARVGRRKRRERERQVGHLNAVPWERHAAVVRELERVSAVLADLIESQQGAAVPAREVVSWVKNPAAVHHLLASSGLQGIGTEDDTCCAGCGCDTDRPHARACTVFDAWWVLGMVSAQRSIDIAMEAAQAEDRARSQPPLPRRGVRITGLFDRAPNTDSLRGYRDRQLMVNPRDLGHVEPLLQENGIGQFDGITVHTSDFVRPRTAYLMNPADFALFPPTITGRMEQAQQLVELGRVMPAEVARFIAERATTPVTPQGPAFRREYLGEFPGALTPNGTRQESDARGLEAVEAEARRHDEVIEMSGVNGPPMGGT